MNLCYDSWRMKISNFPFGRAIEDILLLANCSLEGEWEGQVIYLPLR